MSKITKRKYVVQEVMDLVVPTENQQIVQITGGRGNNLHAAVDAKGENFLVSMPTKFRKNIYIKRGDFVIIDPIEEGDKVRGEIAHILFRDNVHHIQDEGLWPEAFEYGNRKPDTYIEDDLLPPSDSEDDDNLAFRVVNANKGNQLYEEHQEDEEEGEDEETVEDLNVGENTVNSGDSKEQAGCVTEKVCVEVDFKVEENSDNSGDSKEQDIRKTEKVCVEVDADVNDVSDRFDNLTAT